LLAKPDPALGYINGELRVYLGWAHEVAGDHAAAQESWRQARSELEPFLKEQPENYFLIEDIALTNMGLGDKAAALTLAERAMALVPIEKDALDGPGAIEILARVAARLGEPDRAIAALQKLLSIPYSNPLASNIPLTPALLRLHPRFGPAVIFSWVFELTPQGLKREDDVAPEQSITPQTGRRMDRMIIVVLVLALGYFAFDKFALAPRREAAGVAKNTESHPVSMPNE